MGDVEFNTPETAKVLQMDSECIPIHLGRMRTDDMPTRHAVFFNIPFAPGELVSQQFQPQMLLPENPARKRWGITVRMGVFEPLAPEYLCVATSLANASRADGVLLHCHHEIVPLAHDWQFTYCGEVWVVPVLIDHSNGNFRRFVVSEFPMHVYAYPEYWS